ncbi:CRISPR system precrRNA processing endoribonuclease RAMP protein Cas6, partial [Dialister sp.]|uniref:CRISPR system precrRNA processing endoribonuclease RAMP protein Cas6 n=1 Tax=Dialister sp. TaxID=1955814 RepID=UPI003EFF1465
DDADYAFPDPALLWGSLADKWIRAGYPMDMIDKGDIKTAAAHVWLASWNGRSRKIYFGRDRGVLAFTGTFTYDLSGLSLDWRQMLLLLAQFATFSGIGRLCGQGLGEVEVFYN